MKKCPILALAMIVALVGCAGNGNNSNFVRIWGSSEAGLKNGKPDRARFSNPVNIVTGPDGTTYVADFDNDAVREIAPDGKVSTLVKQAGFERPFGLALVDGALYVQTDRDEVGDSNSGAIWWVNPLTRTAALQASHVGRPRGMTALPDGRIATADIVHHVIRIYDPETATSSFLAGQFDSPGFTNGTGDAAMFNRPYGLAVTAEGDLLVADQNNNAIRKVTMAGEVSTYAGTGIVGSANGDRLSATFNGPQDVSIHGGEIFIADTMNHLIRKITANQVTTFAGNGVAGFVDGTGTTAEFFGLEGIDLMPNGEVLWIADGNGGSGEPFNRVRRLKTH